MDATVDFSADIPDFSSSGDGTQASGTPVTDPAILSQLDDTGDTQAPDPSSHIQFVMNNLEGGDKITTDNNGAKVRWGINQAANPDVDLNKLTSSDAEQIYKDRYWNKINGDKLPSDMQLPALAFAANAGPGRANKLIEESDGDVDKFMDLQKQYYQNLGSKPKYADQLPGWMNRLDKVKEANGKQYASADTGTQTDATYDNSDSGTPVTDPDLISQLEAAPVAGTPVTDPKLIGQLEGYNSPSDLPGMATVPDLGPPVMPVAKQQPQVPVYGNNGVTPISPKAPIPTDDLMLAGRMPNPDFFERTAADWKARNNQLEDINQHDYDGPGGQSTLSTLTQTAGNIAGRFVGDPLMNALGSAGRYFHTGDIGDDDNPNNTTLTDIVKGAPGAIADAVGSYANPGFKQAADYVKSNPELQRNLSAANDLAMAIPFAKPITGAVGAVDTGVTQGLEEILSARRDAGTAGPISIEDVGKLKNAAYQKADMSGQVFSPDDLANNFAKDVNQAMPKTLSNGQLSEGDSYLNKILQTYSGFEDKPLGINEVDKIDKNLTGDITRAYRGGYNHEAGVLRDIQDNFRTQTIQAPAGADLAQARGLAAAEFKMRDLQIIKETANTQNEIKTGLKTLYKRIQKKPTGWTDDEISAIKTGSKTGLLTGVLNTVGSKLISGVAGGVAGGVGGNIPGALAGAAVGEGVGFPLRQAAKAIQASKLNKAIDLVTQRPVIQEAIAQTRSPKISTVISDEAPSLAQKPLLQLPPPATITPPPSSYAPKQITYQPITGTDAVADSSGSARLMTLNEQNDADALRKERANLGLTPDVSAAQAARSGADSNSGNLSINREGNPGKPITSPADTNLLGTQVLEPGSNSTILPEPSGIPKIAQNLPESYRGPVQNLSDINDTPIDTNPTYHDINDKSTLLDKAKENLEPTLNLLRNVTQDVPGAKVMGARIKDPETLDLKIKKKGMQPNQISDYLGSRIQVDDNESAAQVIKNLGKNATITHEDNFMTGTGRPDTGYRAIHLQVKGPDGFSHEVQIMPKELMDVYEKNRALYAKWKDYRGDIPAALKPQHDADQAAAKKLFDDAWTKYESRNKGLYQRSPIEIRSKGASGVAITPTGDEVKVHNAVVEGADLIASQHDDMTHNSNYPQVLQPRDRSTFASHQQVARLASNLNPRLLMDNPLTSEGAPIVSKDGVVESGNGRVLAIRKAAAENPQGSEKYRQALKDAGYNVDGVKNPILVRIRQTPMTDEQRIKLTQDSNVRSTAGMSSVEQAKKDASKLSSATLDKFTGGDVKLLRNRDFIRSAIKDMVPDNEQASVISKDGGLSQEAERRIGNALLTKAYDDEGITRLLTENTDNELTSLGKALTNVAPAWAKMREMAKSGAIPANMDITPSIVDATKAILKARQEGNPLSDYFRTKDLFDKALDKRTAAIIQMLHNKELTRLRSADKISKILNDYARKAGQISPGVNLFGEEPVKPNDVLDSAIKENDDDDKTSGS